MKAMNYKWLVNPFSCFSDTNACCIELEVRLRVLPCLGLPHHSRMHKMKLSQSGSGRRKRLRVFFSLVFEVLAGCSPVAKQLSAVSRLGLCVAATVAQGLRHVCTPRGAENKQQSRLFKQFHLNWLGPRGHRVMQPEASEVGACRTCGHAARTANCESMCQKLSAPRVLKAETLMPSMF